MKKIIFILLLSYAYASSQSVVWTEKLTIDVPTAKNQAGMAKMSNNEILLHGGTDGVDLDENHVYSTVTENWTQINPTDNAFNGSGVGMVQITNNEILLFGGFNSGWTDENYIFNTGSGSWTQFNPATPPSARSGFGIAKINNNEVLLFGGDANGTAENDTWIFNITTREWTEIFPTASPSARASAQMAEISTNSALLFSGGDNMGGVVGGTWIFDGDTREWTEINPVNEPSNRFGALVVNVSANKVMLFGGDETPNSYQNDTWVYDFDNQNWTQIATTTQPFTRRYASGTSLGDNKVLLYGGFGGSNLNDTWEATFAFEPEVSNINETQINDDNARISFDLNGGNVTTNYFIEYGLSSGNYSNTVSGSINTNSASVPITLTLSNLSVTTQFFYRVIATNSNGTSTSSESSFSTVLLTDDNDSDGINNEIEDAAPNNGDGNNDGTPDSQQEDVSSLQLSQTQRYVTLEIISACPEFQEVNETDVELDRQYIFPFGAVEFKIPCPSAEIKLYFYGAEDLEGYTYRKLNSDNSWFNYGGVTFDSEIIDGETVATVVLNLTDGGPEDYDGVVNGSILDPGGPALRVPDASIPIWDWWHLLVLSVVLFLIVKKL